MKKIKLSFCITTFNRADYIGETLESIIPQVSDVVEIVIVDGASTDMTEKVVQRYQKECPQIRYFKQEQNMGVDRDYNKAVEQAQGEYCWLMTDDDLLKPGAVETVLKNLSAYDYELVIVNAEVRTKNMAKVIQPNLLGISTDTIYGLQDQQRLFIENAKYLSFIGGVVIKRLLWQQREKEKYFGTVFVHVGVIFQKPMQGDVLAIACPGIEIRYGNALWTPKKFEVSMFKWPRLIWSFSSYSEEDKNKIIASTPWDRIRTLTLFRAVGAFTLNEYRILLKPRMSLGWKRLAAKAVAQMPPQLLNFLWIVYLSYVYRKSQMWLYDLKNSRFNYLFKKGAYINEN
jgi:abequosyltransferase